MAPLSAPIRRESCSTLPECFGLPTSTGRALYGKLACRAFTRCLPTPEEYIPSGLDRVRVDSITMSAPYPSRLWRCQPTKGPGESRLNITAPCIARTGSFGSARDEFGALGGDQLDQRRRVSASGCSPTDSRNTY